MHHGIHTLFRGHAASRLCGRVGAGLLGFTLAALLSTASAVRVTLIVQDEAGQLLPVRASVIDALGRPYPAGPDPFLLSHSAFGGYFYLNGQVTMTLISGVTDILISHGFEWRPAAFQVDARQDTIVRVTLERFSDLRSQGWYPGDDHCHSNHGGAHDYHLVPSNMRFMALCENLAQLWILDWDYYFTGGPDPISDSLVTLYYSTEYRNMAMGHVSLLGLTELMGHTCCRPPDSVYPPLSAVYDAWSPGQGQAQVLLHPRTGVGFFEDDDWPGNGLGRELPVLAALGRLDGIEVMVYSAEPDVCFEDWYRMMGCGLRIPPTAGTDASPEYYDRRPIGGYQTYVRETPGQQHSCSDWVDGLRAGHSFVTNTPLIPIFTVNGAEAGEVLELPGPSANVEVRLRVESALNVDTASIMRNGVAAAHFSIPAGDSVGVVFDTTLSVSVTESAWIAARVDGETQLRHVPTPELCAHTAAVYVHLDGASVRQTADAAPFFSALDSLELFVELRDNWNNETQHNYVTQLINDSRDFFCSLFVVPPCSFPLLMPAECETLDVSLPVHFVWGFGGDPEIGDRLSYRLECSSDTTFSEPQLLAETSAWEVSVELHLPTNPNWWRVVAIDRGGNERVSLPAFRPFYVTHTTQGLPASEPLPAIARFVIHPNPALDGVSCALEPNSTGSWGVRVFDLHGRRIAGLSPSASFGSAFIRRPGGTVTWLGCDDSGRQMPSGLYWLEMYPIGGPAGPMHRAKVLMLR